MSGVFVRCDLGGEERAALLVFELELGMGGVPLGRHGLALGLVLRPPAIALRPKLLVEFLGLLIASLLGDLPAGLLEPLGIGDHGEEPVMRRHEFGPSGLPLAGHEPQSAPEPQASDDRRHPAGNAGLEHHVAGDEKEEACGQSDRRHERPGDHAPLEPAGEGRLDGGNFTDRLELLNRRVPGRRKGREGIGCRLGSRLAPGSRLRRGRPLRSASGQQPG